MSAAPASPRVRVIGAGRAGGSFALALGRAGWVVEVRRRGEPLAGAASGVDAVLVATPDDAIASVAAAVEPVASTVVLHVSGASGLGVLAPHERVASVHPLMTLPDPERGAALLRGAWFAVAGDGFARRVVDALDGRAFAVDDAHRAAYHAAACIASNHVVALLGQVARVAAGAGVPFDAFGPLVEASVANAFATDPATALTGPARRADWGTIARHLVALAPGERDAYLAGVRAARLLATGRDDVDEHEELGGRPRG